MEKSLINLFNLIEKSGKERKSIGEIIETSKSLNDDFIDSFFQEIVDETNILNIKSFNEYHKYVDLLSEKFNDCFEYSGGKKFRFYHSQNVAILANKICETLKLNPKEKDVIILSALFHDIGKSVDILKNMGKEGFCDYEKRMKIRHEDIGADMVFEILKDDFSIDIVKKVSETIRNDESDIIYAKILHDADDVSEHGVINVFKMIYYSGCDNRDMKNMVEYWFKNVDEQKRKEKILKRANFEISKDMVSKRLKKTDEFMNGFLELC